MPWGKGLITEEITVVRDHWEPTLQLLEYESGEQSIRFCVYNHGRFSRNPLMVDAADLDALRKELDAAPKMKAMLKRLAK